jgi:hypothetical protein
MQKTALPGMTIPLPGGFYRLRAKGTRRPSLRGDGHL